ncbi:MAG TPA: hypothetical protein VJ965_08020, partial [Anaerolineales bacterium]|nr:hypothetical protein [Anaerolineales bacterium]
MKKWLLFGMIGVIVISALAVTAQPASAIVEYCFDPDDGPEECFYDYTPEEYCLYYLPSSVDASKNPDSVWDEKESRCYFYHDNIGCAPNWNMLGDFFKIYTADGTFMDDTGRYVWMNGVSGCAILKGDGGFQQTAFLRIRDGGIGSEKFRDGDFDYEYATCSGLCRVQTAAMTAQAKHALIDLPYKVYKNAFVTILNSQRELAYGTFRLCYNHDYNEN